MAHPIIMPNMSMFTSEGTVTDWLKPEGARVEAGEPILVMTTDKAAYEIEAPVAGILHPVAALGVNVPVEAVLGYILASGEDPPVSPSELAKLVAANGDSAASFTPTHSEPAHVTTTPLREGQPTTQLRASPVARRVAAEHGIDLARVTPTGPGGRIVEKDVLTELARLDKERSAKSMKVLRRIRRRVPLANMRRTIGERLRHSLSTTASLTLTREVRADILVAARGRLASKINGALAYDALFIKLMATVLSERPEINATIENDAVLILDDVHVGFAVPVPDGLVVPVVHNADREPLGTIAAAVQELRSLAHSGRLRPTDVEGGTTTVTNLGAYGIDAFTPILNPPQSTILGIGRIAPRPIVSDDEVVVGRTCVLSLTFDHRITDGVPAAELLDHLARLMMDEPYLMSLA